MSAKPILYAFLMLVSLRAHAIKEDDVLAITRYPPQTQGQLSSVAILQRKDEAWKPVSARAIGDSEGFRRASEPAFAKCFAGALGSMFLQQQALAISKYVQKGLLTHEEGMQMLEHSVDLTDRPITFYNILTQEKPKGSMAGLTGSDDAYLQYVAKGKDLDFKGYASASLFSVAGQRLEIAERGVTQVHLNLPWMMEPDFKEAAKYLLSRDRYPLIWELGRAASMDVHEFPHLMAMAGRDIAVEALHYGVPNVANLDHAYVSAYFITQENTEKFLKLFPNRVFLRSSTNPWKTVFVVPLKEYLDKFPLRRYEYSNKLAFETKLGLDDAHFLGFEQTVRYSQHKMMDLVYNQKSQHSPILMSSTATGYTMFPMDRILDLYKIKQEDFVRFMKAGGNELATRGQVFDMPIAGHLVDPSATHKMNGVWSGFPIQVSNLDPVLAKTEPDYVPSVLTAVFDNFAQQIASSGEVKQNEILQILQSLKQSHAHFVVTTQYPETAAAIRRIGPAGEKVVSLAGDEHTALVWNALEKETGGAVKRPSDKMYTFSFDPDRLMFWRTGIYYKNHLDPQKVPMLAPGYHWWLQGVSEP